MQSRLMLGVLCVRYCFAFLLLFVASIVQAKGSQRAALPSMPLYGFQSSVKPPTSPRKQKSFQSKQKSLPVLSRLLSGRPSTRIEKKVLSRFRLVSQYAPKLHLLLETNKPLYQPGETIWFRGYVAKEQRKGKSVPLPGMACQLVGPRGRIVLRSRISAHHGVVAGHFSLPQQAAGGVYTLRMASLLGGLKAEKKLSVLVYKAPRIRKTLRFLRKGYRPGDQVSASLLLQRGTGGVLANHSVTATVRVSHRVLKRWRATTDSVGLALLRFRLPQRLTSDDVLLAVSVRDGGVSEALSRPIPLALRRIRVGFFPEGGQAIEGLENRVFFAARRVRDGKPVDVTGIVKDHNGSEVTRIRSFHDGMGSFVYRPSAGKRYLLHVGTQRFSLPIAQKRGVAVRLLTTRAPVIALQLRTLRAQRVFISVVQRQSILATRSFKLVQGKQHVRLPLRWQSRGIARVTLWNEAAQPIAERLVFRHRNGGLRVTIQTNQPNYLPREKVSLTIRVKDRKGRPVVGAPVGIAVVDDRVLKFADDHAPNILAQRFLIGRLTGRIYRPNFYFGSSPKAEAALDFVMGTHGWRGLSWKRMKLDNIPRPLDMATWKRKVQLDVERAFRNAYKRIVIQGLMTAPWPKLTPLPGIRRLGKGMPAVMPVPKRRPARKTSPRRKKPKSKPKRRLLAKRKKGSMTPVIRLTARRVPPRRRAASGFYGGVRLRGRYQIGGTKYRKKTTVYFDDSVVQGELVRPEGLYSLRGRAKFNTLIPTPKPRWMRRHPWIFEGARRAAQLAEKYASFRPPAKYWKMEATWYQVRGWQKMRYRALSPKVVNQKLIRYYKRRSGKHWVKWRKALLALTREQTFARKKAWVSWKHQMYKRYFAHVGIRWSRVRQFPVVFYQNPLQRGPRSDFRETVYWSQRLRTDRRGKVLVSFGLSERMTTYRIAVTSMAKDELGLRSKELFVRRPLFLTVKAPLAVSSGDAIALPVTLHNRTSLPRRARVYLHLSSSLRLEHKLWTKHITLSPWESRTAFYPIRVKALRGTGIATAKVVSSGLSDAVKRKFPISPTGFPREHSWSGEVPGRNKPLQLVFMMPKDTKEVAPKGTLRVLPDPLSAMELGMRGMLREPHGCFEQASSSNYPNVMILQYLRDRGQLTGTIRAKALSLLSKGYRKLVGFETRTRGYEWFGRTPGHEALTAYGLMQFTEMQSLFGVDPLMMKRAKSWLLGRRDGKGGFLRNRARLDSFGAAPKATTDTYITYALVESGVKGLQREIEAVAKRVDGKVDTYVLALAVNTLAKARQKESLQRAMRLLAQRQKSDGSFRGARSSITRSFGRNLQIETTSLAILGLLKAGGPQVTMERAMHWLRRRRGANGLFGTTQATILALKATLSYQRRFPSPIAKGRVRVEVNGKMLPEKSLGARRSKALSWSFVSHLKPGTNRIKVWSTAKAKTPFAFGVRYTTQQPRSVSNAPISVKAMLSQKAVRLGRVVRLTAEIRNRTKGNVPMVLARIRFPAGLRVQMWQLKRLKKRGFFDFFEVHPREVVLYLRGMKASAVRRVQLDLIARVPGHFTGGASMAYLYYTNERKHYAAPLRIKIRP